MDERTKYSFFTIGLFVFPAVLGGLIAVAVARPRLIRLRGAMPVGYLILWSIAVCTSVVLGVLYGSQLISLASERSSHSQSTPGVGGNFVAVLALLFVGVPIGSALIGVTMGTLLTLTFTIPSPPSGLPHDDLKRRFRYVLMGILCVVAAVVGSLVLTLR